MTIRFKGSNSRFAAILLMVSCVAAAALVVLRWASVDDRQLACDDPTWLAFDGWALATCDDALVVADFDTKTVRARPTSGRWELLGAAQRSDGAVAVIVSSAASLEAVVLSRRLQHLDRYPLAAKPLAISVVDGSFEIVTADAIIAISRRGDVMKRKPLQRVRSGREDGAATLLATMHGTSIHWIPAALDGHANASEWSQMWLSGEPGKRQIVLVGESGQQHERGTEAMVLATVPHPERVFPSSGMIYRGEYVARHPGFAPDADTCQRRFLAQRGRALDFFDLCIKEPPPIYDATGRFIFLGHDLRSAHIVTESGSNDLQLSIEPVNSERLSGPR